VRCNVPAAVGFEHDGAQREHRGRSATCAHRPADETKSNEDQKLCEGRTLQSIGCTTTEHCLGRRGREARAAGAGRDVCSPTRRRDRVERGPEALRRWVSLQSFGCTTSGHCLRRRGREAQAAGAGRDVCAPTRGRDQVERGPEALRQWGSLQSIGCTTSGHCLGRRGRDARAAGAGRVVCAPTCGRDRVERGPGQRSNRMGNVRCNVPAAVGFEHDGAQREQRGRGATCAHRPADETKSNEDQKLCDSGDRSNQLVAPPRDIALDDVDEKREQRGWGATCAHRPVDEIKSN